MQRFEPLDLHILWGCLGEESSELFSQVTSGNWGHGLRGRMPAKKEKK
jgi:hypothetical protein